MSDLVIALICVLLVSALLAVAGAQLSKRLSRWPATLAALVVVVLLLLHGLLLGDRLEIAWLLPLSSLPVAGNWAVPVAALLAGVAWRQIRGTWFRKLLVLTPLAGVGLYSAYSPLLGDLPPCIDRWQDGMCMQTHPDTCAPAAAATLLKAHGINASEGEMARLCLTRNGGTTMLGVYRGLKLKTAGTPWRVQVTRDPDAYRRGPVLLSAMLRRGADVDPRYEKEWGWKPGVAHTVLVYGDAPGGKIAVGDPRFGREQWHVEAMRVLQRGPMIRLVRQ